MFDQFAVKYIRAMKRMLTLELETKLLSSQTQLSTSEDSGSKSKEEDVLVEPPPRKIKNMDKNKQKFFSGKSNNRKLDEFMIMPKPKMQQPQVNPLQIEYKLQEAQEQNRRLIQMLDQLEYQSEQFGSFAQHVLQKALQQNFRLKSLQTQRQLLHFKTPDDLYKCVEKRRQCTESLSSSSLNSFDKTFTRLQKLRIEKKLDQYRCIQDKARTLNREKFYYSRCSFKLANPSWGVVSNIYQPLELCYQNENYELYKALNLKNLQEVAIKLYNCQANPQLKKIAQHQFDIHSKLIHKNVLRCMDIFEFEGNKMGIVYEWADYGLCEVVKDLSEEDIIEVCRMVSEGLLYLRANQIVHGKVNSNNILFKNGNAKICDFALAAEGIFAVNSDVDELVAKAKNIPSFFKNTKPITQKFDVFSLGIILFECIFKIDAKQMTFDQIAEMYKNCRAGTYCKKLLRMLLFETRERPSIELIIKELKAM